MYMCNYYCKLQMSRGLFVLVVSILAVSLESARNIPRLPYGVYFKDVGSIVLATNNWKHTFQIDVPHELTRPVYHTDCESLASRLEDPKARCPFNNALIEQHNNLAEHLNDKLIQTLDIVTKLSGPKLNIPSENDTLPTRSRFPPAISSSPNAPEMPISPENTDRDKFRSHCSP